MNELTGDHQLNKEQITETQVSTTDTGYVDLTFHVVGTQSVSRVYLCHCVLFIVSF